MSCTTLGAIAERVWRANGATGVRFTAESMRSRLAPLMTPWTGEGFFAEVAVLVEGESDRAAVLGTAMALDMPLESRGFVVIPCSGKSNIPAIAAVFQAFGIATYYVWDADAGKGPTDGPCPQCTRPLDKRPDPTDNQRLLRLAGAEAEDWPRPRVEPTYACFEQDLETTMRDEIGARDFDAYLETARATFGMSQRKHAIKNPAVLAEVLRSAREGGHGATTLETIVCRILTLGAPLRAAVRATESIAALPSAVLPAVAGNAPAGAPIGSGFPLLADRPQLET